MGLRFASATPGAPIAIGSWNGLPQRRQFFTGNTGLTGVPLVLLANGVQFVTGAQGWIALNGNTPIPCEFWCLTDADRAWINSVGNNLQLVTNGAQFSSRAFQVAVDFIPV